MERTDILAGYRPDRTAENPDAQTDTAVFSIEAQQIVKIRVGGATEPLQAGKSNDLFNLRDPLGATLQNGGTADFYAFEIA